MNLTDYYWAKSISGGGGSSGGGVLKVTANKKMLVEIATGNPYFDTDTVLDKTYVDLKTAMQNGQYVYLAAEVDWGEGSEQFLIMPLIVLTYFEDGPYTASFKYDILGDSQIIEFNAATDNDPLIY